MNFLSLHATRIRPTGRCSRVWNGRGEGLLADAERALRHGGVITAWFACAIGNSRAERFYEKQGWHRNGR